MKRSMKLCVAGGGKMAEALVGGLLATGWAQPDEIGVIEVIPERRSYLAEMFPGVHLAESCQGACASAVFDVSDVLIPGHSALQRVFASMPFLMALAAMPESSALCRTRLPSSARALLPLLDPQPLMKLTLAGRYRFCLLLAWSLSSTKVNSMQSLGYLARGLRTSSCLPKP
jgi:hypothetical protein